ncbi:MAG: HD domain-containing protein, partial [Candidatus Latescibacteria bacterium]|nr:HD domain-containing protein [Candidatus Latescibacterota bacterium]
VWKLAKAAEARDKKTGNHILRVGHYCRVISEKLGMEDDFTELIFLTSPLHDIGKIGIPDKILLKPGKLTPDEKRIMDQHCVIGAEILLQEPKDELSISAYKKFRLKDELSSINNPILKMGASIALGHHEWWNGKGYPKGLSGENIPLEARIVAISDMYDALSFSRPYKPAFSEDKISLIMRKETVSHFDPVVFSSFEKVINDLQSIKVQYSDE